MITKRLRYVCLSTLLLCAAAVRADESAATAWVDSVMATLSADERLGQLIMPIADPADTPAARATIRSLVERYHVGGLLFSSGTVASQTSATRYARSLSATPMWIALDGEWGPAMRLRDAVRFPRAMTLASISTRRDGEGGTPLRDSLLYAYGLETARECRALGVQINFAPVLDVNTNAANPVIGNRSFGETVSDVVGCALSYASGLEDGGVMAVGKHFPGHGDTDKDSHKTLPRVGHPKDRLWNVELAPYRYWAREGYGGVMVGHLDVPALGTRPGQPASTSRSVVGSLLRDTLGFRGLVFTDGMAMKGVSDYPDAAVCALDAGVDVLLDPVPLSRAWQQLKAALADGRLSADTVDARCRRVLAAKYRLMVEWGHESMQPGDAARAADDVVTDDAKALAAELYTRSLVLLKADTAMRHLPLGKQAVKVIDVTGGKGEHLSRVQAAVDALGAKPYALVFYTTPYVVRRYADVVRGARFVVVAHEDTPMAHDAVARALRGDVGIDGRLRVSVGGDLDGLVGLDWPRLATLPEARPEEVGMSSAKLRAVDQLARDAVARRAVPGCQVLVARDGRIVYNRAFGRLSAVGTPASAPVKTTTLYDLASVTKAAATVPALMAAMAECGLSLDDKLADYIPELRGTALYNATVRTALLHETGLQAWYPFQNHLAVTTSARRDSCHTLCVAPSMWIEASERDSMLQTIAHLQLKRPGFTLYSDLNFVLLRHVVERVSGMAFDDFVARKVFAPLHAGRLTFCPLEHDIPLSDIAPTERDDAFRHCLVHGTVHDETAALAGGVEGNAGLFGSAEELVKVLQMLLDDGQTPDGRQLIPTDIVRLFTAYDGPRGKQMTRTAVSRRRTVTTVSESHRGLGFDRPNGKTGDQSNVAASCPASAFGHTGFTGTCFWIDPEERLIYIFLSNRVHPTRKNTALIRDRYRPRIQQAIYDAIER